MHLQPGETSVEDRAAAARALAEAWLEAALAAPEPDRRAELEAAGRVPGEVLADEIVAAGEPWSGVIRAGEHLRIVDLKGCQAVDFLCYDHAARENRDNAANTIKLSARLFLGEGATLWSEWADPLVTVSADTVGFHDTIGGCCTTESNFARYGIPDTPSCRSNFLRALATHGMGAADIVANVNWFMVVTVEHDGTTAIVDGRSQAGDYVDLRAERDVLVVISNCPQLYNPANGWLPTPIRLILWQTDDAEPKP